MRIIVSWITWQVARLITAFTKINTNVPGLSKFVDELFSRITKSSAKITRVDQPTLAIFCFHYLAGLASNSMVILMDSPTTTPPVSNVWFHVKPKSLRSISPLTVNPTTSFPQGSTAFPSNSA